MRQSVIGTIPFGGAGALPRCRPPSFLVRAAAAAGGWIKKLFQICLKSGSEWFIGLRSSLHEDFVRVKTLMGLERFEVGKKFSQISQSLGIY